MTQHGREDISREVQTVRAGAGLLISRDVTARRRLLGAAVLTAAVWKRAGYADGMRWNWRNEIMGSTRAYGDCANRSCRAVLSRDLTCVKKSHLGTDRNIGTKLKRKKWKFAILNFPSRSYGRNNTMLTHSVAPLSTQPSVTSPSNTQGSRRS